MEARAGAPLRELHFEETTWKARPDWARDGTRIVYSGYHGRQWNQLWLLPAVGGDPIQLTCMSGDLVLMHYLLVHGITLNHSPHVRYTTYFRLKHIDHDRQKFDSMLDPWLHWEAVRELAKSSPASDGRAVPLQDSISASRSILSWFRR